MGNIFIKMPKAELHAMEVPKPSRNLSRYDIPMKPPTVLRKGRKAKQKPESP